MVIGGFWVPVQFPNMLIVLPIIKKKKKALTLATHEQLCVLPAEQ